MKKVIVACVFLAACHHSNPPAASPAPPPRTAERARAASGNQTGAADAAAAVRGFLAAAKEQDLQAMGAIFGDDEGPARDRLGRKELEERELIMAGCLRHDRYDIAAEAPLAGGGRSFVVTISLKNVSSSTNFQVVEGPAKRWYVKQFDINALGPICRYKG